ncbi:TATA-binding protein-associated factor 172-like [Homarus americanus]|uniref:TATA-binding protein-associated factor 172-like n=1 Tax=Homarus americanus TaxID=6706 RepID=UPI001C45728B|nr:TATA-binding protein-associated factor 172-like [Homarus americanus]
MSSRLDRLFLLLENGGSGVTRQAAAQQLGEVVRLHPHELNSLINRVHVYLSSKSWDVRIAAGLAVEAIVSNVPQWNPQPLQVERGVSEEDCVKPSSGRLSLGTFNISHVLQKGSYLMAADEKLFEAEDENMPLNPADRLACQRRLVNQRLGLDIAEAMGIDTEGIFTNDDLAESPVEGTLINGQGKENVMNIVKKEIKSAELALSSRELNRARRKAKLLAKQKSVDVSECVTDEGPEKKRMRVASMVNQDPAGSDDDERMVVDEGPLGLNLGEEGCEWPLENFCEILATDLFSLAWETRHGAATALRQVIKVHGRGGGKTTYHTKEQMEQNHQAWLEDMAVRLMCVLALDRFGDFVSDQVVAPVRETCAQALGSILHLLSEGGVYGVLSLLETMLSWGDWEARHGGLLGLKYLLAVREDLRTKLFTHTYPHIYKGLLDEMDDVVAVAASCLVPVADSVVNLQDKEVVMKLVATLWDALLDIDDLTSSTNSILMLLAKLLAHPGNSDSVRSNLGELVPRLWPFLYHSSSSVRGSALKTLDTLTAYTSPAKVSTDTVPLTSVVKEKSAKESHQIEKSEQKVTKDVEVKIENVEILTSSESINTKVDVENIEHKVSEAEKENNKLLDTERQSDKSVIRIKEEKVVDSVTTKSRDNGILSQVTRDKEDINMESTIKTKKEVNAESLCKEENTEGDQTKQEMVPTKTEETTTAGSICSNKAVSDTESSKEMDVGSVKTTDSSCAWLCSIIQPALTHIYQRALLEKSTENLDMVFKIWRQMLANVSLDYLLPAVCPMVSQWLYLTMANPKVPLDVSVLLIAHHNKSGEGRRLRGSALNDPTDKAEVKFYLGSCDQFSDANNKQKSVIRARCAAAKLLGRLSQYVIKPMPGVEYPPEDTPVMCYVRILLAHLVSQSAVQRLGAGAVVREWASIYPNQECHPQLQSALQTCLTGVAYYDEIAVSFTKLQEETRDFMAMLRHYKLPLDESFTSARVLTLEQIQNLSGHIALTLFSGGRLRPKVHATLEERRKTIQSSVSQTSTDQISLATTTQAVISGAVVRFRILPRNLNPVIKPLMDSIKKEKNEQLQSLAAEDLTKLLELCIDRPTCPNGKVVKNLASFLCIDQECTPKIPQLEGVNAEDLYKGILSLSSQLKNAERQLLRRSSSVTGRGPGRPPGRPPANAKREDPAEVTEAILENENQRLTEIQRRGCTVALQRIAQYFGEDLPQKIPQLWDLICNPFTSPPEGDLTPETSQEAVNWFQLLEVVVPALHTHLVAQLETKLHLLDHWLYHPYCAVRHMATRVMGALACVLTVPTLTYVVESIVPALGAIDNDGKRQGAVECIYAVIDRLGFSVVPYIVLLIVPLLGRMSDPDNSVRHMATYCFATLIRLLPLEGGVPDPPSLSEELLKQKMRERQFLEKLMDPTKIENYKVPVPINAELRSYQQNGVNWLAFLNQYKLHGILCDDMGLGKTLQSICILAGDHYAKDQDEKAGCKRSTPFQSLVVCPPTLTGHWVYEVEKFVKNRYLNPLHYTGPPTERYKLRRFFPDHNLIVASYDIVRNDIEFFSQIRWNYVILDEGHIIKNGKTKSCKAIKQLIAHHRLILSGTPIQNNVLELWSLFDFLMPGFLGTERQFMARYSKPILQSRDAKSSSKEQEAGVLAMEALHRQALPFLLRRVKEDVLSDLPPKITQDYYCELSPLQEELYEDFARTQASQDINESLRSTDQGKDEQAPKHGHIFQALQYLRKVCNHPKLVLKPRHPEYERISAKLKTCSLSMSDISHSAKLPALKQLLLDCGIGVDSGSVTEAVVSQHRALIFCQLKAMLDIIENDLLKVHLPNVTYLRLDGSVPAGSRHALVQRFNGDPSIDLLLLTTQVGGLGLNLIGADTVIFVEHDWNPMRDLQAMDRAHRIGQKRVVNVYRLITRGTLEEKIMGLQKFKMMTANTVISHENSSLLSMGTDQLLDLFTLDSGKGDTGHSNKEFAGGAVTQALGVNAAGAKAVLENLPDLWDQNQYENEYDLDTFMVSLKK